MYASQHPKLVLMTAARLWLTMYCAERSTPSELWVDAETTKSMVAWGATAPDHCTSRSASANSSAEIIPGSEPLTTIVGLFAGRPKVWRNVRSEEHTSELQSLRHLVCR